MKKIRIIFITCFVFMIVGMLLLSSTKFSTAIGNWVWQDVDKNIQYTQTQSNLFVIFMMILLLGSPVIAIIFAIVRRILHKRELKRLEREGKIEEYREKAEKYNM